METKTNYQELYTSLGYLFYSIAASDGNVRNAEVDRLKQLIKEQWVPVEKSRDEFGTDAAHYIGISFDYANDGELSAEDAFERFKLEYKTDHSKTAASTKRIIMETAAAIASSFAGNNKAELVKLSQLGALLK